MIQHNVLDASSNSTATNTLRHNNNNNTKINQTCDNKLWALQWKRSDYNKKLYINIQREKGRPFSFSI